MLCLIIASFLLLLLPLSAAPGPFLSLSAALALSEYSGKAAGPRQVLQKDSDACGCCGSASLCKTEDP